MCPGGPSVSSVPVCPRPPGDGGALGQSVTVSYGTGNARQLRRASQCRGMLQHLTGIEQIGCRRPGVRGEPLSRQCGAWGCFPQTGGRPAFTRLVPGPQQLAGEGHAPCSVTQPTAGSAGATAAWRTARQWHGATKAVTPVSALGQRGLCLEGLESGPSSAPVCTGPRPGTSPDPVRTAGRWRCPQEVSAKAPCLGGDVAVLQRSVWKAANSEGTSSHTECQLSSARPRGWGGGVALGLFLSRGLHCL